MMMSKIGKLIRTLKLHYEAQIRRNINLYQPISKSTTATSQEAIDLNSASPNKPTKKVDSEKIPIVRLPEDLINSAQELLDSITNQSTIRTSALGLYSKYQLTGLKKTLELDQKEILIKYLDLLQNQAIKDLELKKKNSNDGDGEGRAFGLFSGSFDSGKSDPSNDKDSEVLSLKEEAERAVNEKALAKVALIMSNPSQHTSFDDKPLSPVKESPKAPPPPRTRDKVIGRAKAFESAENTPSPSHFSPNHQTSNQISEHLLPERQPPFLNNLGPVAATNPSAPLLYEYSEHSRLSKDLSEYIVQSQEKAISRHQKEVFFANERVVPLEHANSNFASTMDCFLSKAPIKRSQIISIMSLPPEDINFADMTPMISSIYEAQILDELETNATDPIPSFVDPYIEQCLYYLKLALARLRGGQSLHPPVSEKPKPPKNKSGGGNHINAGSSEYTAAANASSNYPSQEIKQELSSFVDQEFSEGTLLPHATGFLRTEGYYCITSSQKAFYLPQRNKAIIDVGSLFNNQSNVASASALAVSWLTRVNSRRFVVNMDQNKKASTLASASINTVTDALKFNQLQTQKKQLKFSRSPIHDVSLLLISPEMISHYKHGIGAGFSFESENILKKLETRFALLERCKENENLMQCWSLTKSNFNNCSTRKPLSLLRYSNSRFSLPSPAETVENLSSSALNKGLSLALERKFSKSPCRTPPSRTTASETNLSVPAANFSHLQALSNSGSALSERAFDDSENLSTKGEKQNLSRKLRIKRQVSATIDPTQAETNNIEADSIQALQETNVAIQNATSKRLSTLVFQKPVSIHSQTALAELSGKEENYTYQHCLASSVNQQQILGKLSAWLIEKSSRSPNAWISLLMGNGKDDMNSKPFPLQSEPEDEVMSGGRGGRGGRVNSVAAKWAKMAASEKAKLSSVEKSLSKSLRKGNDGSEALKSGASSGIFISKRAIYIREREPKAIALLKHIVSQDKGWTEFPLVSESHYKHGMGAGFLTPVSVVLSTRSWFGLLVLVVWNILKNNVL
ncbi:hypothetical protein PPACK8108_LOCUS2971 [Phakopsora pachyrhizi]|uniref:COMPASS complex Set1 subunit N-SET domain-containing protein n=1 Tax=Phakopsora pachyrhizi TaxID=170000 RepID=A0AAV0ALI2_PHAPC|nr:hypothetical protein PPACK8108_LOCUS2971 [Phakopsora pachyrhizi]